MSLKIGDLATRSSISVRTLHHYDEIGLLCPEGRTLAGHRVYSLKDVQKLQEILMLKNLGFSLEAIKTCFESSTDVSTLLEGLMIKVKQSLELQTQQLKNLEQIMHRLKCQDLDDVEDLFETIEIINMIKKYYTEEQLSELKGRYDQMSQADINKAQKDWEDVFEGFSQAHKDGLAIDAPSVVALATKAQSLIAAFTGGNQEIAASLKKMYKEEGGTNVMKSHGPNISPDVFEYYQKAMENMKS